MPILESPALDAQSLIRNNAQNSKLKPTAHVIPGTFRFATLLDTKEYQPRLTSSKRSGASGFQSTQQFELQRDREPLSPLPSSSTSRTLASNTSPITESIFQMPHFLPRTEDHPYDPYQIRFPKDFSPEPPPKPSRVNPRWATPDDGDDGIISVDPYRIIYPPSFGLEGDGDATQLELAFDGKVGANPALGPFSSTLDPPSMLISRATSEPSSQFEHSTMDFASSFDLNGSLTQIQPTEKISREAGESIHLALETRLENVTASAVTAMEDGQVDDDDAANDVSTDGDGAMH